jgi:NAD(P)H dehydrogenase (quinone)
MANILIVHAHHEPKSFTSALARTAAETFTEQGHRVDFSDLYAMKFDPVSDRRNFTMVGDPNFFKQQQEELYAAEHLGFAPEIEAEMQKLERCDLLVFSFPLWWFGLPAILKGWVDRVFAYGRIYGRGRWYDKGLGRGKRAMVLVTTGGAKSAYDRKGLHPELDAILTPIHHGIFWFNGFSPLQPFVAWAAAHGSDADRKRVLDQWRNRLKGLLQERSIQLPHLADFDEGTFRDRVPRYMVMLTRHRSSGDGTASFGDITTEQLDRLHEDGVLLRYDLAELSSPNWRGFLVFRERSESAVLALCAKLFPPSDFCLEIVPVAT